MSLDNTTIHSVIERAQTYAEQQAFAISIAVTDDSGLLCGFLRMQGSAAGTIDVAIKKARTAALFRVDSLDWVQRRSPAGPSTPWKPPTAA